MFQTTIAVLLAFTCAAPAIAQPLLKKGQVITLKIPSNLLSPTGSSSLETAIAGSDGALTVQGRDDWEQCCMPSLIELEIREIDKPKKWRPTTQIRTSTRPGMGIVYLNFAPTIQNVEAALARVALAGPPTGSAAVDYSKGRFDEMAAQVFTGALAATPDEKKHAILRFIADEASGVSASSETYKDQFYFAVDLGQSSMIYNTLQLNESARVARMINDRVLKLLKGTLPHVADLSGVQGVRLDLRILHKNFLREYSTPDADVLRIYAPLAVVKMFADAEITSQELVDGCVILVNDNRVRVVLTAQ